MKVSVRDWRNVVAAFCRGEATKRHRSGGSSDCGEEAGKEAASP